MAERERLIKLIDQSPAMFCTGCNECPEARAKSVEMLADYLIASDVVEVVRCKDCLYVHFNSSSERYTCQREYPRRWVEEDDFCNNGRREGNV